MFSDTQALLEAIKRADKKTRQVHGPEVFLERAIFLSWYCEKGSCQFCYMSTQKERIRDGKRARRRPSSILAEAELLRRIGWKVAFLAGGYGVYPIGEIREMARKVHEIVGEPIWLNTGILSREDMSGFDESVEGVVGSVETVNKGLHRVVCPGKPLEPVEAMLDSAKEIGLKTGMTIILGLGESAEDLPALMDFIERHRIDRITLYTLNPHPGTPFADTPPPPSLYQAGVTAALRLRFPRLRITAGTWIDQLPNIGIVLLAGANGITKYPLFRMFGNRFGRKVEEEIAAAGRRVVGTFTDASRLEGELKTTFPEREEIESALQRYVLRIRRGCGPA
ncbi:MAG: radical SAM protein [Methanobacteriota archaeon]|nr:MAG: radical SAM protein [Euryarchaeota archaeon]